MPYLNLKTTYKPVCVTLSNFSNLMRDAINPNNLDDKTYTPYPITRQPGNRRNRQQSSPFGDDRNLDSNRFRGDCSGVEHGDFGDER